MADLSSLQKVIDTTFDNNPQLAAAAVDKAIRQLTQTYSSDAMNINQYKDLMHDLFELRNGLLGKEASAPAGE